MEAANTGLVCPFCSYASLEAAHIRIRLGRLAAGQPWPHRRAEAPQDGRHGRLRDALEDELLPQASKASGRHRRDAAEDHVNTSH